MKLITSAEHYKNVRNLTLLRLIHLPIIWEASKYRQTSSNLTRNEKSALIVDVRIYSDPHKRMLCSSLVQGPTP